MTLETHSMWASGGIDHLMRIAVPMVIFGAMIAVMRHAYRSGLQMFTGPDEQPATEPLVQLDETPGDQAEPEQADGSAQAYDGFNPAEIYGPTPQVGEPVTADPPS